MRRNLAVSRLATLSLAAAFAVSACGQTDEQTMDSLTQASASGSVADMIKVSEVQVGKAVDSAMMVTMPTMQFMPMDTVHLSVATTGAMDSASVMLMLTQLADTAAVLVHEPRTISTTGPAVTHFHYSKTGGMALGKYKAEIFLNGALAEAKEFEVVKSGM